MAGKPDIDIEEIRRDIRQANGEGAFVRKPVDPATGKEYERCSHALFPGSQMGAYEPELLVKLYDSLHFQMPDAGVIFLACGMAAKEAGDEELYRECLARIEGAWEELGRPVLLMACPQCMAALRKELPQIETVSLYKKLTEMDISGGCNHDEFILSEDDEDIRTQAEDMGATIHLAADESEDPADGEHTATDGQPSYPYLTGSMSRRNQLRREGLEATHILELIYGMSDGELPGEEQRMQNRVDVKQFLLDMYWNE